MNKAEYIIAECDRQHVTNYDDFENAFTFAWDMTETQAYMQGFPLFVMNIAYLVEPQKNQFPTNRKPNFRQSEVGFLHGTTEAAKVNDIHSRINRWAWVHNSFFDGTWGMIDETVKSLLDIHPWEDGNGRTASILRNWLAGTMENPYPLPYYYGVEDDVA